jgi:hypothetical protein
VISVASKASMARAMFSKVTGSASPGKAARKSSTYCGMLRSVRTTRSGVLFISTAAWTGPLACSRRSSARPSQNCAALKTAFSTVGALRGPFCQPWPTEVSSRSTPASPMLWQVLQLISQLEERRGSKKSIRPSSTFSGVTGLFSRTGTSSWIGAKSARTVFSSCSERSERPTRLSSGEAPAAAVSIRAPVSQAAAASTTAAASTNRLNVAFLISPNLLA